MFVLFTLLLGTTFWSTSPVQAQTASAVCQSTFSYLSNSRGQSPCLVAAYMQAPCTDDTTFAAPALKPGQHYAGPSEEDANYCTCSSVVYSLVSACAECQGTDWVSWSVWRGNCSQNLLTVAQYPLDIPAGTAVPAWAYQDVTSQDKWSDTAASASTAAGPESTYYGTPTASINYHPSFTADAGTLTTSAAAQTTSQSNGSGGVSVGAIVGGVIGGIGLLALIGALVWLLLSRRQGVQSPTGLYNPRLVSAEEVTPHLFPVVVDYGSSYPQTSSPFTGSTLTTPPKLYDPSDPTTFPKTPAAFGYQSNSLATETTPSNTVTPSPRVSHEHSIRTQNVGRYSGAPEI